MAGGVSKANGHGGDGADKSIGAVPDDSMVGTIARRLKDSLLPGDAQFTPAELKEAARCVLALAAHRLPGEGAITVESVTGKVGRRLTRIAVVNDNMPFLVDSISAVAAELGLSVDRLVHPLVNARRDADGALQALPARPGKDTIRESVIYIETPRVDARTRARLRTMLDQALGDVRAAVADWPNLQQAMADDAARLVDAGEDEGAALLNWFNSGMLTQLGHVVRKRDGSQTGALGICRKSTRSLLQAKNWDRAFAWFDKARGTRGPSPLILKANRISNVHRRVPLDLFLVPIRDGKGNGKGSGEGEGKVTALSIHAGVWTSAAMASPPRDVPVIRAQLAATMDKLGIHPADHDGKALVHAMTALPHDVLIGFEDHDLERIATTMMSLVDRPRPRIVIVRSPLGRHVFAFVWLQRDTVSTDLRQQVTAMLEDAANATVLDWSLEVEGTLALLRFTLDIGDNAASPDEDALADRLGSMMRGWGEAVEAELAGGEEPARAAAIAARYADAFPLYYRTGNGPAEAALDIQRLRAIEVSGGEDSTRRDARLHSRSGVIDDRLDLKIYQRSGTLPLSDAVPMLENFGFRVISEIPTLLNGGELGAIHDFDLMLPESFDEAHILARAPVLESAIAAVLNGEAEDDAFNRLIASIGLSELEANGLRAMYRYLRQAGSSYGIPTAVQALERAPDVTRGLLDLFAARHDPGFAGDRAKAEKAANDAIRDGLAGVGAINDDRLLRHYRALITAILRTNAYQPDLAARGAALAFKIDSALVPGLPAPLPWREVFVYSRRVEGIHLRAGPIARGGLRWSDRRDDYRTEVLGLMKAQRVKNAVIVPTGAKGGFYPKQLPDPARDRDAWAAEGRASYQVFIRSLLSLTDNIVGGRIVHPQDMVIHDGDDPYFVVAADKGTATFSDTANAIAEEAGFWLGDAFASGGSKGYDHKAMAITARGAWISVQRHFLEMGIDVQTDAVRVAGCGDMSGDVFGNGMLLSQAIELVAAFDHRHIFIDPRPDAAKSWQERKRLFGLPRSSWADYDAKLISKGGGVFSRSQKEIVLSPEARAALGIEAERIDPDTLISAILKSPVDLLWFGGIGTYIKAAHENNATVGDHGNDTIRVDGDAVRAKVVGEGANLGVTQAGRIQFAMAGGRINTDFIDNSAGVDCSDNEVNIKIALAAAMADDALTEPQRVKLLVTMTGSVADIVLEDNRLQTLALSVAEAGGANAIPSYVRLIEVLEDRDALDRKTEGLADSEALDRRAAEGGGLTRPELAVLLSSAKIELQDALEHSGLPDDPGLADDLVHAFPPEMQRKFREDILHHRLRREIVATRLSNRVINRMGMIHPYELVEEEGATLAQVGAAFVTAVRLFDMTATWHAIETTAMPEAARILLFDRAAAALRPHLADLLRAGAGPVQPSQLHAELEPGVNDLRKAAGKLLGTEARHHSALLHAELVAAGAPEAEAMRVTGLFDLDGAVGVARLARMTGHEPVELTRAFVDLGARLGLDWAQSTAAMMIPTDPWERLLVGGLARDFQQMRLDFLKRMLGGEVPGARKPKADAVAAVAEWAENQAPAIRQYRGIVARARESVGATPAILAQLASQARSLLAR